MILGSPSCSSRSPSALVWRRSGAGRTRSAAGGSASPARSSLGLGVLLLMLVFAMIYKTMPERRVAWRDVLVGAAFTSLLFIAGGADRPVHRPQRRPTLFGAAASLVVLLWVYLGADLPLRRGVHVGLVPSLRLAPWPAAARIDARADGERLRRQAPLHITLVFLRGRVTTVRPVCRTFTNQGSPSMSNFWGSDLADAVDLRLHRLPDDHVSDRRRPVPRPGSRRRVQVLWIISHRVAVPDRDHLHRRARGNGMARQAASMRRAQSEAGPPSATSPASLRRRTREAKALLDAGTISQAEFDPAKAGLRSAGRSASAGRRRAGRATPERSRSAGSIGRQPSGAAEATSPIAALGTPVACVTGRTVATSRAPRRVGSPRQRALDEFAARMIAARRERRRRRASLMSAAVAVDDDQVGERALGDTADAALHQHHLGRDRGRLAQQIQWREHLAAQRELAALVGCRSRRAGRSRSTSLTPARRIRSRPRDRLRERDLRLLLAHRRKPNSRPVSTRVNKIVIVGTT